MSVSPHDICQVADELSKGTNEAAWRSALSRAYYAAYHACDHWHSQMPVPGSVGGEGGSHQKLCNQLRYSAPGSPDVAARKSRTLGAQLDALRVRRKVADYQLEQQVDQAEAKGMAATSALLLQKMATFP
jgi:hypothetical protein